MNNIKRLQKPLRQTERIRLNELKWKVWLWVNVYADDFESCALVAHCSTTGAAEEIK